MLNRIMFAIVFIMNTLACTSEVIDSPEEDPMGLTPLQKQNLQQRSKTGLITPGTSQKVGFQLPEFLDPSGHPDYGNYTCQFNLDDPNTASVDVLSRAEIIWKVSGNDVRRVIDVSNGASITGTAEGVSISVFDASSNILVTPKPYTVSLQVVKGSRPSIQQPPTYTTPVGLNAGAGDIQTVAIPQNIGAVSVSVVVYPFLAGTAIGAYDVRVAQISATGTLKKVYDPRQDQWVPLASGVTSIVIGSSLAAPQFDYQVTFGIDG